MLSFKRRDTYLRAEIDDLRRGAGAED